jgi:hypothetical protein
LDGQDFSRKGAKAQSAAAFSKDFLCAFAPLREKNFSSHTGPRLYREDRATRIHLISPDVYREVAVVRNIEIEPHFESVSGRRTIISIVNTVLLEDRFEIGAALVKWKGYVVANQVIAGAHMNNSSNIINNPFGNVACT